MTKPKMTQKVDFGRFEVKTQKMGYTRNEWSLMWVFFVGEGRDPYKSAENFFGQKFRTCAEISASTNWEPTIENPKNDRFSEF